MPGITKRWSQKNRVMIFDGGVKQVPELLKDSQPAWQSSLISTFLREESLTLNWLCSIFPSIKGLIKFNNVDLPYSSNLFGN